MKAARSLESAQKVAWTIAWRYRRLANREARKVGRASQREDLTQEALMGLQAAALRFEHARGKNFETYGRWWARAYCTRYAAAKARPMSVPGAWVEQKRNLSKLLEDARAKDIHLSDADLQDLLGITAERLADLRPSYRTDSLSEPAFSENDRTTIEDTLADTGPLPDANGHEDLARVQALLEQLPPRQKYIVEATVVGERTMTSVGQELGICKERVRQDRNRGLQAIREGLGIVVVECSQARCRQPAEINGFCRHHTRATTTRRAA